MPIIYQTTDTSDYFVFFALLDVPKTRFYKYKSLKVLEGELLQTGAELVGFTLANGKADGAGVVVGLGDNAG